MQILEIGTVAAAAGGVGVLARHLDLDDVGAPIGELAHRGRPGAMGGQIDDEKPLSGSGVIGFLQTGAGKSWAGRRNWQDDGISPVILRRKIGDYNRDGRCDILWQDSSGI